MIKHELEWKGRKITPYLRSSLALKMKDIIAGKAKAQQGTRTDILQNSVKGYEPPKPVDTQKELSKLADVSHDTIHKVEVIEAKATPEQIESLRNGDKGVSINKVYQEIKAKEQPQAKPEPEPQKELEQSRLTEILKPLQEGKMVLC